MHRNACVHPSPQCTKKKADALLARIVWRLLLVKNFSMPMVASVAYGEKEMK